MAYLARIEAAVHAVLRCAGSQELVELASADEETIAALQRAAAEALDLLCATAAAGADATEAEAPAATRWAMAAEAVLAVSTRCLALGAEVGLSSEVAAELVSEGLAASAALFCNDSEDDMFNARADIAQIVLESLGRCLDDFKLDIFSGFRRLDELLHPQWALSGDCYGGRLFFNTRDGCGARGARGHCALQGVCIWMFALVIRIVGYRQFTCKCLWEFASVSHDCLVYIKAALCFGQAGGPDAGASVPHDLNELRDSLMDAALGLSSPDIAFLDFTNIADGGISIAERNEALLGHHVVLAISATELSFLDCLLAYPWRPERHGIDRIPAFATFLAALSSSAAHEDAVDLVASWMLQVRLRSAHVWSIVSACEVPTRRFMRDCAALAWAIPPPAFARSGIVSTTIRAGDLTDSAVCAAVVAFAVNGGCAPDDGDDGLASALVQQEFDLRSLTVGRLQAWTGPLRRDALAAWIDALQAAPQPGAIPVTDEDDSLPPALARGSAVAINCDARRGLGELLSEAPPNLCCALDGVLLVDPVVTPSGLIFERATLARALEERGSICPITGVPLTLAECKRDAALRTQILRWVRESHLRKRGS